MILTLSSIVICCSVLSLMVFGLYRHQQKAGLLGAERYLPMGLGDQDADFSNLHIREVNTDINLPSDLELEHLGFNDSREIMEVGSKEQVCESKEIGDGLEETAYPLLGAYSQHCISLRKALKEAETDAKSRQHLLASLYRNAAEAELLHGKSSPGKMPLSKLKMLPEQFVEALDMPYQLIGYKHLKLLRKSDITRFKERWGEPDAHQYPRDYHRQRWDELYRRYG